MSFHRRVVVRLVLLLLVALPLRSLAAVERSMPDAHDVATLQLDAMPDDCGMSTMHDGSTREAAYDDTHSGSHGAHGACSVCCCAAVIVADAFRWPTPRDPPMVPASHARPAAPAVVPDGLERPPRTLLA